MALTRWERKARIGFGAVTEIAKRTGTAKSTVSMVLNGRLRHRAIEVAISRRLGMKVDEVFPPKDDEVAA